MNSDYTFPLLYSAESPYSKLQEVEWSIISIRNFYVSNGGFLFVFPSSHMSTLYTAWSLLFVGSTLISTVSSFPLFRPRGRLLPAFVRLRRGILLRPPLLDQNLQASAEAGRGVHQTEEERLSRLGNLPTL